MKNNNFFSYQPENSNQKIWCICPDPKSEFIVLEIRTVREKNKVEANQNTSQLLLLDSKKKEISGLAEMEATQTLITFFDKTILLSEIDIQNEMPIAKGLQALNMDFETIWEFEEVSYYGIIEEKNQNQAKVIFTLQSNYYSTSLKLSLDKQKVGELKNLEAKKENYDTIKGKTKQYFYSTDEYSNENENYKFIWDFIFEKTNQKPQNSIFYTENSTYLICSYLVENEELENDNYILCTDKKGNLKLHFFTRTLERKEPKHSQEIILMQNKLFWLDKNEFRLIEIED